MAPNRENIPVFTSQDTDFEIAILSLLAVRGWNDMEEAKRHCNTMSSLAGSQVASQCRYSHRQHQNDKNRQHLSQTTAAR
jgi:hypothetical protein